jgi:hypothetical protein
MFKKIEYKAEDLVVSWEFQPPDAKYISVSYHKYGGDYVI